MTRPHVQLSEWEGDRRIAGLALSPGDRKLAEVLSAGEGRLRVTELPESVREHRGYARDMTWRPLKPGERRSAHVPKTSAEYVDAFHADDAVYYWFHRA